MASAPPFRKPIRYWGQAAGRLAVELVRRGYAVGIIAVVIWVSFLALRYLIVTLVFPTAAPAQITGIPTRLTEAVLETRRTQWPGVTETENARTPLAHYHRLGGWIQPDRFSSCTQSGCHAPLPHARRKEVRAFLNMHATSLHCGVCHVQSEERPLTTTWYDLATGQARAAPTVLQVYAWLVSDAGRQELAQPTPAAQQKLVDWLRAAARAADNEPALAELAAHVAAERYDSAAFQRLVEAARATLPRHFRGEYGAKLALQDRVSHRPVLGYPGTEKAIQAYLREAPQADAARREQLLAAVHPDRRVPTLHCTQCHVATGSLLDFAAAGYPPARIEMLSHPAIFGMIEHIAAGQPFYLPGFVQPEPLPTTGPAPD
jgi:hypothetical protein